MRLLTVLFSIVCAGSFATATAIEDGSVIPAEHLLEGRQAYKCAAPGYRRSNRPYFSRKSVATSKACGERCWSEEKCKSYSKFFTKSNCNLSTCSTLCKSKSRCQSFRHGQNTCVLFTAPVAARTFKRSPKSPFTYYDRNCVVLASSSTLTGSTTASSATSSTSSVTVPSVAPTTTTSSAVISTPSSSVPETTIEDVRIAFKRVARRKRQTDGSVDLSNGYISRDFKQTGERYFTSDENNALEVKITFPQGGPVTQTRLNLINQNSALNQDLTALALVRNTAPGQAAQLFLGAARPGAPPADGTDNSLKRANQAGSYVAQSAIWTVNLQTFETSAQWINDDGSASSLTLMSENGSLFMTSDPSAFPNAETLSAQVSSPDLAAVCATIPDSELVNGQCVKKCQTGLTRVPGTIICAQPTAPCPADQRSAAGLCICIDRTQQVFNGTCVPLCNISLQERRNYTTGACGCRADMSRASTADVCTCPGGQVNSGTTCDCDSDHLLNDKGVCVCRDYSLIEVNGVCTQRKPDVRLNAVRLSFTLPGGAAMRKRQGSGSRVDLGYGYISADFRETGERYLTNDPTNALEVNIVVPDRGAATGQQLSLQGTRPFPGGGSYITTLALILDNSTLDTGHKFGSSASNRLNLGAGTETYAGRKPSTDASNSMDPSRSPINQGKSFVYETAVWNVDMTTGKLDVYWIDDTGASFHMMPVTNGDNLFFAGDAIYDQINATPLQLRAEIPGTPSSTPPSGEADCRTGTVQCPACSDDMNQCRASNGTCVARDDIGACGYNCSPGSPDCWKCPTGYFGKGRQGCTALPCPEPDTQFRNRTGCFAIPTCVPPQVYIGNGQCGMMMGQGGTVTVSKPRTTSTPTPTTTP